MDVPIKNFNQIDLFNIIVDKKQSGHVLVPCYDRIRNKFVIPIIKQ